MKTRTLESETAAKLYTEKLPNCRNFRDMGGIGTSSGKVVKSGLLYRSGRLTYLTCEELQFLTELGISKIIDLRSHDEIAAHPDRIPCNADYLPVYAEIPDFSLEAIIQLFREAAADRADTEKYIISSYRKMPNLLGPLFRELFTIFTSPAYVPTLIHCTGGKDRTGLFAALFLYALGVEDDVIMEDYLMSGHTGDDLVHTAERYSGSFRKFGVDVSPEITHPLLTTKPEYLQAALDAIRREYGSVVRYLDTVAAVGAAEIQNLRTLFLI
ncbi:MAG: tyrosine-protein phosphatase [Spirochaetales bacterium]|nr:tyrosine-protein phosphatase [Spirochaetales bacterium]